MPNSTQLKLYPVTAAAYGSSIEAHKALHEGTHKFYVQMPRVHRREAQHDQQEELTPAPPLPDDLPDDVSPYEVELYELPDEKLLQALFDKKLETVIRARMRKLFEVNKDTREESFATAWLVNQHLGADFLNVHATRKELCIPWEETGTLPIYVDIQRKSQGVFKIEQLPVADLWPLRQKAKRNARAEFNRIRRGELRKKTKRELMQELDIDPDSYGYLKEAGTSVDEEIARRQEEIAQVEAGAVASALAQVGAWAERMEQLMRGLDINDPRPAHVPWEDWAQWRGRGDIFREDLGFDETHENRDEPGGPKIEGYCLENTSGEKPDLKGVSGPELLAALDDREFTPEGTSSTVRLYWRGYGPPGGGSAPEDFIEVDLRNSDVD